jgi:hypothetical protein
MYLRTYSSIKEIQYKYVQSKGIKHLIPKAMLRRKTTTISKVPS